MVKTFIQIHCVILYLLFFTNLATAQSRPLPTAQEMKTLKPQSRLRIDIYDIAFSKVAERAEVSQSRYSDVAVLNDLASRLEVVAETGNPRAVLKPDEWVQFDLNNKKLKQLEAHFFAQSKLKLPMNAAIKMQGWVSSKNSPLPQGEKREDLIGELKVASQLNLLYQSWDQELPKVNETVKTWGDLLITFSNDPEFRKNWVESRPETLARLKELSKILAWEDTAVRSVTVVNQNSPLEYWVFDRRERPDLPNRLNLILDGDFDRLLDVEFSPSLFFNRIKKIETRDSDTVFHLEAIEKGRTMELTQGSPPQIFPGATFLRKSKSDEFLQRAYVEDGRLSLFLGMRTMHLDQIQALMEMHPTLIRSVGQFGFSITGGKAQTVSNRTDTPEEQFRKATATLIDIIEFAQVTNVESWFRENTQYVLRTILAGVGAGGHQALTSPLSTSQAPIKTVKKQTRSCRQIFK